LRALPASLAASGILRVLGGYLGFVTPGWLSVIVFLVAFPARNSVNEYWTAYQNRLGAAAHGAVLVPRVPEGGFAVRAALVKSVKLGYPGDVFLRWRAKYGETFTLNFVQESRVVTFEPEVMKAMLAAQFENFSKGPVLFAQFGSFLGSGVFNSDGDMWKFHRSMTRPFFSKERITDFDIFDRHAHDAINQAAERLDAGYPIDFQDLVSRFTLDSATEFLFGRDVRTLSAGLCYPASSPLANSPAFVTHPSNTFANAFTTGQQLTLLRTRYGPTWPLLEFWKNKVKPHRKVVDEFIQPILTEALAKQTAISNDMDKKEGEEDSNDQTLLSHLVGHTQDPLILIDELVNLLVAGRDTTATTLTFAMYMLTQHPNIAQRLREEILNIVGRGRPTFDQMKQMKYLRAFINGTLSYSFPIFTFDCTRIRNIEAISCRVRI